MTLQYCAQRCWTDSRKTPTSPTSSANDNRNCAVNGRQELWCEMSILCFEWPLGFPVNRYRSGATAMKLNVTYILTCQSLVPVLTNAQQDTKSEGLDQVVVRVKSAPRAYRVFRYRYRP